MAPKTAALAILLVVSIIFADNVQCRQQLVGSEGHDELAGNGGGGGGGGNEVSPKSICNEETLYNGPCIDMICAAACFLKRHRGGHCKGGFMSTCLCFVCK